LINFSNVIQV